jgi:microcystin-dependent protein
MDSYLGEIRLMAGALGFQAPTGWHLCDGTLLPVSGNEALYSLLGTTYGGNGSTTFGVPDLRGRVGIGEGVGQGTVNPCVLGQAGGTETVTLTVAQNPAHTHPLNTANTNATTLTGGNSVMFANVAIPNKMYVKSNADDAPADALLGNSTIGVAGGNGPHNNMMPGTALYYIISLSGIYPQQ